jgi:hypothetical protein
LAILLANAHLAATPSSSASENLGRSQPAKPWQNPPPGLPSLPASASHVPLTKPGRQYLGRTAPGFHRPQQRLDVRAAAACQRRHWEAQPQRPASVFRGVEVQAVGVGADLKPHLPNRDQTSYSACQTGPSSSYWFQWFGPGSNGPRGRSPKERRLGPRDVVGSYPKPYQPKIQPKKHHLKLIGCP